MAKASQEKKGKSKVEDVVHDSSSDDEIDDANLALMVRTTKMLKKLNKNSVKFDGKNKKLFTSSKRKPNSKMDCYNCGDLGHLAHQCPKPKKDKYKKNKDKKDDSSDDDEKEKTSHTRRRNTTRRMARLILLVIGSRILNYQVAHPVMKVTMTRRRWSLLWLGLHYIHNNHGHHPLHTYALWPRVIKRYKVMMIVVVMKMVVIVLMNLNHPPMMI
jgi:hypothetical protein